jgi:hypothetical protein
VSRAIVHVFGSARASSFLIFAGRPGNSVIGVHFLRLLMNMVFSSSTARFRVGPSLRGGCFRTVLRVRN